MNSHKQEGCVLIISNNVNQVQVLINDLYTAGFSVLIAQSSELGYQRTRLLQPDLILLDVLLPDLDGVVFCRRLKADEAISGIPVIFLATLVTPDAKLAAFSVGAVDYVTKPFEASEVVVRVRTHINLQRLTLEQERRRLGRELHDSVTQSLYSLVLLTNSWQMLATQGRFDVMHATSIFGQLNTLVQSAYQEIRLLIHQLRPPILAECGLVDALQQRLTHVEQRVGLKTQLLTSGDLDALPPLVMEQFFFIAQEALNNVLRHARATTVSVCITRDVHELRLAVIDNGCGFDPTCSNLGVGLTTMRERTALIGGSLAITATPQCGTTILVTTLTNLPEVCSCVRSSAS